MSQMRDEIKNIFETVEPRPLRYKLNVSSGWRGTEIRLKPTENHKAETESFLANKVLNNIDFHINLGAGTTEKSLNRRVYRAVQHDMFTDITDFIMRNHRSKNVRLTSFYKWFKYLFSRYDHAVNNLDEVAKNRLEDLLFNVYKYIYTDCNTREHKQNCIGVLEFIKNSYEGSIEVKR